MQENRYQPTLSIVIPCFNEQDVLTETISQLSLILHRLIKEGSISNDSFMLFVDDGSKDATWETIKDESQVNSFVTGLKLAKNAGHQHALLAGLLNVIDHCDCSVSIDADLQDDPNVITDFVHCYQEGMMLYMAFEKLGIRIPFLKNRLQRPFTNS